MLGGGFPDPCDAKGSRAPPNAPSISAKVSFGEALEALGGLGELGGCFGRLWGGFGEALGGFGEALWRQDGERLGGGSGGAALRRSKEKGKMRKSTKKKQVYTKMLGVRKLPINQLCWPNVIVV